MKTIFPVNRLLYSELNENDKISFFFFFRIMHDEVSETENIRKNLAIERMIVEGCEILLDTSQTFVRQGNSHL